MASLVRVVVIASFVVACHKEAKPSQTSAGSGSVVAAAVGSAAIAPQGGAPDAAAVVAPATHAVCFTEDSSAQVVAFAADEHAATFCVKGGEGAGEGKTTCARVDLATGAVTEAVAPVAPAAAVVVKQSDGTNQVCKGDACVTLALPPADGTYMIAVSDDGAHAVATLDGDKKAAYLLDAQTGKKLKTLKVGDAEHPCPEEPSFANDRIFIPAYDCNGAGATGFLYGLDGKRAGTVENVDVERGRPYHLDGNQFAFAGRGGGGYEIVDVKTGKSISHVGFERPSDCDDKHDCFLLGEGMYWSAIPMVTTPAGLVVLSSQTVRVVNVATGKVDKSWRIPACPAT